MHVPVFAERSNDPPAHDIRENKKREHGNGERRYEWTMQEYDFGGRTDQHQSVKHRHARENRIFRLGTAAGGYLPLMLFGNAQLEDAHRGHGDEQGKKEADAQRHV